MKLNTLYARNSFSSVNYGVIRFQTPYETLSYEVEVLQNQEYDENHHVPELLIAQILKEYIGFVAGRIDLKTWVGQRSGKNDCGSKD